MIFYEYSRLRDRLNDAKEAYLEILDEKAELFARTQPKAVAYDGEKVAGGTPKNPFDEYLILKEKARIDERLEEAKAIVMERLDALEAKEKELRQSDGLYDIVYKMRYVDGSHVKKISKAIGYSKSQTYRIIERVDEILKLGKYGTKCD